MYRFTSRVHKTTAVSIHSTLAQHNKRPSKAANCLTLTLYCVADYRMPPKPRLLPR